MLSYNVAHAHARSRAAAVRAAAVGAVLERLSQVKDKDDQIGDEVGKLLRSTDGAEMISIALRKSLKVFIAQPTLQVKLESAQ